MFTLYWNGEITYSLGKGCKDVEMMTQRGLKERRYMITNRIYRDLVSAAIKMKFQAVFGIVFFTSTFPYDPSEEEAQAIFKNFMKNLKTNYNVKNYLWVKERQKNGRLHYHFLAEVPYCPIKRLQKAYNSAILGINRTVLVSNNSLRLPNSKKFGNLVRDPRQLAAYIGKYLTKGRYFEWRLPCFGISKNLYPLSMEVSEANVLVLKENYSNYVVTDREFYAKIILKGITYPDILRDFNVK